MKIYTYAEIDGLPEEEIWIEEDDVVSNIEHKKKWALAHDLPDEYSEENTRNYREYWCSPWDGTKWENDVRNTPYKRVLLERKFILKYYEVSSVEEFLRTHENQEVIFDRGYFFHKTWMD